MNAIYSIIISGNKIPVLQSTNEGLVVLNQLVLLLPGHINVEKEGEDNLYINDVWDIHKALSQQTLRQRNTVLREDTDSNEFI